MKYSGDCDTRSIWCTLHNTQRISKGTERHRNKGIGRNRPDNSLIQIDQNTEKNSGDQGRPAVTQTQVWDNHSFRICTQKFLNDEPDYVEKAFIHIQYTKFYIERVKIKVN